MELRYFMNFFFRVCIMHCSIEIFYLLVLKYSYVAAESFVTYKFDVIPLGHSGLLISWKSDNTTLSEETHDAEYIFSINTYIVRDENINRSEFVKTYGCSSSIGQYKIHSLKESSLYEVIVQQTTTSGNYRNETYSGKIKTNLKSKRKPAKPYLEFITKNITAPFSRVKWFPCGKEKICHDQESGTHFGISIKELDNMSGRRLIEMKQEEFLQDFMDVFFSPGVMYEVVVYSVNGEHETDSDPQEVFVKPKYSAVQYVKVISLPDSSVLISWKPPKWSLDGKLEELSYLTTYLNCSDLKEYSPFVWNDSEYLHENKNYRRNEESYYEQRRFFGLSPEIIYTYEYIIIPYDNAYSNRIGFEYRMKHKVQVHNPDLPIAKPDFNYKISFRESQTCWLEFQWLPCGKSFDCKNTKPGSEYTFQIKPEPITKSDNEDFGYYEVRFDINLEYLVTAKSSYGNSSSESVKFTFKNCSEIPESTYLGEEIKNEL